MLLHERFDTERALAALMDPAARVTLVSLVPTMLTRLLDAGLREPPSLRRCLLGGGPMAPALLARARDAGVPVSPSFGMTETGSQIATDGFPLLGAELSLSAAGELLVRGPSVSAGALSADGWLHTGDLATLDDDDGRLAIIGRRSDMIVSGGENVAPAAVEAVLSEHPDPSPTSRCWAGPTRSGGRRSSPRSSLATPRPAATRSPSSCAPTAHSAWLASRCPSASSSWSGCRARSPASCCAASCADRDAVPM